MPAEEFFNVPLPDVSELERLANQFFSAPSAAQKASDAQPESLLQQENKHPQSGAWFAPRVQPYSPSSGGSGISPSAIAQPTHFDVSEPPTSLPDPHFAGTGYVPSSQGSAKGGPGSQAKPANATDSKQFRSSGTQDRFRSPGTAQAFPAAASGHVPAGLAGPATDFSSFHHSFPAPQIPFSDFAPPDYYFLAHKLQQETGGFDVNAVRRDFPILAETVHGRPLIWLDNAATTQKPRLVIDRISHFYEHENSNIHRAAHELAARATDAYESARKKVQEFLHASSVNEIIFVRGATEAINLVAKSWGEQFLKEGDEIIVSHLEHHANIVPWQQLAAKKGLLLKVIPVDDSGQILLDEYAKLLGPKVKLVSFTQVSNALGTITPAKKMVEMAHAAGARALVDGAQSVSHLKTDVTDLDCDWFVFSGHKVFGPTGIGVLYGKEGLLNQTEPWQGGGNMIRDVTFEHTQYNEAPSRFEAGTGNIADAVGLGAAIDYVTRLGMERIAQYEHHLLQYATPLLKQVKGLRLIGTAADKASVLSFVLDGFKTEEVGAALNKDGIAVRSGHHCAQPILRRFGTETSVRPSLALYNTCGEIDVLVASLLRLTASRHPGSLR